MLQLVDELFGLDKLLLKLVVAGFAVLGGSDGGGRA